MSYGGWLAARNAFRRPDRLRTIVMLCIAALEILVGPALNRSNVEPTPGV
jgi:pimeloyl-ACP methyl ester carboxylesterase